jgi:hypothetical protein
MSRKMSREWGEAASPKWGVVGYPQICKIKISIKAAFPSMSMV